MRPITAKVYAAFFPADEEMRKAVEAAGVEAVGLDPARICLEGNILRISWEGVYFPVEEVLAILAASLGAEAEGKLDAIDLDAWTLTRHTLHREAGNQAVFITHTRGLDHILAYSGH